MQASPSCSKCGKKSFFFQKSSGRNLCQKCFIAYFERKFQKTMSKYIKLTPDDVVCVGLSGGKDSIALLYNLYMRQQKTKSPKLIAITVDEGISTTFSNNQRKIEKFFSQFQISIPLIRTSYKEIFGSTMDKIVEKIHENTMKVNACTICASIRRRIINEIAKKNGATKIAIGHNLDDVAQSLMMNVLRNDFNKIQISSPFTSSIEDLSPFLPRIKPLFLFSEEEIIHYCQAKHLPYFSTICQNALDFPILRKKVQIFLNELDTRSFEFKYNLIQFHLQVNENMPKSDSRIRTTNLCEICSYPTGSNRKVCTYCEFKQIFTEN